MSDPKPWQVWSPDEEHSEIVYARNYGEAIRLGAVQLECDQESMTAKRLRELDGYTGSLDTWKRAHGWFSECSGCYRQLPYGDEVCGEACLEILCRRRDREAQALLEAEEAHHGNVASVWLNDHGVFCRLQRPLESGAIVVKVDDGVAEALARRGDRPETEAEDVNAK